MPDPAEDEALPGMGAMMTPLLLLLMMSLLLINESIRTNLAVGADTALSPLLPFSDIWFVLTVGLVGSSIMIVNTVFRSFFMDPITQAHLAHRNKQLRGLMREASTNRDSARLDKIQKMQQRLMPEQMKLQNAMMRPMMFTFIFIIAIFSWMNMEVEAYRVDYVSLPWKSEWNLLTDKVLFFPAWIATYICVSAPLGRVVDRHIRLVRYRSHPLITAGEPIPEPLLDMLKEEKTSKTSGGRRRQSRRRKGGGKTVSHSVVAAPPKEGTLCPECEADSIERAPGGRLRCITCRHTWRR